MAEVMICVQSAQVLVDGERLEWVVAGRTTAHADHPVVVDYPHLWRPLEINYPTSAEVDADAAVDGPAPETPVEPSPKAVRAWARAEGVDVPDRGKLPPDVVERYVEARGG